MKITTEQLNYHEVMAYFHYNTTPSIDHCSAIRRAIRPLRVYKKTQNTIVSLEIPIGSLVHFNDEITESQFNGSRNSRKMRASAGRVVQQISFDRLQYLDAGTSRVKGFTLVNARDVISSRSEYDRFFFYTTGNIVTPVCDFYKFRGTCETGIHFYINLSDALTH